MPPEWCLPIWTNPIPFKLLETSLAARDAYSPLAVGSPGMYARWVPSAPGTHLHPIMSPILNSANGGLVDFFRTSG